MKKIRVFILFLCICLVSQSAFAMDITQLYATVKEKFDRQMLSSGFEGEVAFAVEGDNWQGITPETWDLLQYSLPKYVLKLSNTVINQRTKPVTTESQLQCLFDESNVFDVVLHKDENLQYLSGSLIGENVCYSFGNTESFLTSFRNAFFQETVTNSSWPDLLRIIAKLDSASEEWKERFANATQKYEIITSEWISTYAVTSTKKNDDAHAQTAVSYVIPSNAVLQQTKQMLYDFFTDVTLLTLLKEQLTMEEQAAYLQPHTILTFFQMLDNVTLQGDIYIERVFDIEGKIVSETYSFPFAHDMPFEWITYTNSLTSSGKAYQIETNVRNSEEPESPLHILFDIQEISESEHKGELVIELENPLHLNFTISNSLPVDTADTIENYFEHKEKTTIDVVETNDVIAPFTISLDKTYYAKSSSISSPTHVEIVLRAIQNDNNSVSLLFKGSTKGAWKAKHYQYVKENAKRIELMNQDQVSQCVRTFQTNIFETASKILNAFSVTPSSENANEQKTETTPVSTQVETPNSVATHEDEISQDAPSPTQDIKDE